MKLANSTTFVFSQLVELLSSMSEQEYTQALPICKGSTIGMHVRHIVELYQCLLRDLPSAIVDYDNRARNQLLQNSIAYATTAFEQIEQQLELLPHDAPLSVLDRETPAVTGAYALAVSSLQRELLYNQEHCIHHMAIIGMCVRAAFPHIPIDEDFGKAYATIRYEKSCVCVQ